jgi:hypothetical protein
VYLCVCVCVCVCVCCVCAWRRRRDATSIKDHMGPSLLAGCDDAALVQVDIRDANGLIDPIANLPVTFSVQGTAARLVGTANGDPADHTVNTSPIRPAFHGRVMAVLRGAATGESGRVTVTASAPGLPSVQLQIDVLTPDTTQPLPYWCPLRPGL